MSQAFQRAIRHVAVSGQALDRIEDAFRQHPSQTLLRALLHVRVEHARARIEAKVRAVELLLGLA